MHLYKQQMAPAIQKIALDAAAAFSPEALLAHQASVLINAGLSTEEEMELAAEHVPRSGPFLFIPRDRSSAPELTKHVAASYQGIGSRIDVEHPIHDAVASLAQGGYFLVGYDETIASREISASESKEECRNRGRSPLTATEVGFRLMYFPRTLGEMQFAAAGSYISRGEGKDPHVPVFFIPGSGNNLVLGSFLEGHRSTHTLFPSCQERVSVQHH